MESPLPCASIGKETRPESSDNRHCAFCLKAISGKEISLCGQCKRRAYCSNDCRNSDWTRKENKGQGQGHAVWCGIPSGEEDIDWYVDQVSGKGLGLIAKRTIPSKFRILVDGVRSKTDPRIEDLMPKDGTTKQKIILNGFRNYERGNDNQDYFKVCLRIARINHSCDPNCSQFYDEQRKVMILFSEMEIPEGDEISINYRNLFDLKSERSLGASSLLKTKWGITCPLNCFCFNETVLKTFKESKALKNQIRQYATSVFKDEIDEAMDCIKKLIENHKIMHTPLLMRAGTFYDGYKISKLRSETLAEAGKYIEETFNIYSYIVHPESEQLVKCRSEMNKIKGLH